jgi:hypothetical protein
VLNQFLRFTNVVRNAALVVAAIQLVAAGVLIANTIRVAAFARREQTSIMKLVGASNWYIRLPFVLEGVFAGLIGALVSWGLLWGTVPRVAGSLSRDIELMPFIGEAQVIAVGPWLLLAGSASPRHLLDRSGAAPLPGCLPGLCVVSVAPVAEQARGEGGRGVQVRAGLAHRGARRRQGLR